MSVGAEPAVWDRPIRSDLGRSPAAIALLVAGWCLLLLTGVALAKMLDHYALPATLVLGGCLGFALGLALVIARYELAVTIGILLSAVVLIEPAPTDVLFVLIMVVAAVTGRFGLRRVPRTSLYVVAAFLLLNVISLAGVLDWVAAGRFFLITFYLGMFSLWLAAYVDRSTRARSLVRAYLAVAVFSAVLGSAALFVHFPGSSLMLGDVGGGSARAKAFFKDPNVFGPFLVPIALILAEEILNPRLLRLRRSLKVVCLLALCLGITFSYSRAAWLNLAVGLIVLIGLVTLRRPDRRALSLIFVTIVGGVAIAGAVVGTGSLSFLEERAHLQSYDTQRFAAQGRGLAVGLTHPFGVGPGQFDVISPVSSHSLYVRALSEQGVLGLLVIVLLIVVTLIFGGLNFIRGSDTYGISAAALVAAWCGLVANSFFVDTLHWRDLWLVAGLIWAGTMRRSEITLRLRSVRRRRGQPLLLAGESTRSLR